VPLTTTVPACLPPVAPLQVTAPSLGWMDSRAATHTATAGRPGWRCVPVLCCAVLCLCCACAVLCMCVCVIGVLWC
jgi:hypothetical protein